MFAGEVCILSLSLYIVSGLGFPVESPQVSHYLKHVTHTYFADKNVLVVSGDGFSMNRAIERALDGFSVMLCGDDRKNVIDPKRMFQDFYPTSENSIVAFDEGIPVYV